MKGRRIMRWSTLHLPQAGTLSRGITLLAIGILVGTAMLGCRVAAPQKASDVRVHPPEDISANAEQIRLRMRGLVQPMTGVIVAAADQIIAGTTDAASAGKHCCGKSTACPRCARPCSSPTPLPAWATPGR